MKKIVLIILWIWMIMCLIVLLSSCSPQQLPSNNISTITKSTTSKSHTFKVAWYSNNPSAYMEFKKYVIKNCKVIDSSYEVHRNTQFDIELYEGQLFDLQIKHEQYVKNPQLYISIFKGDELQYNQEVNTSGFLMTNYCSYIGNIGDFKSN